MRPETKNGDVPPEEDHTHCANCVKVKECREKAKKTEKCAVIDCPSDCGSMFHKCKMSEHLLLCWNARVSCINSGNGCPFTMLRKETGKHLETCPASVVVCTVEWNRWPTCKMKGTQLPRQSLKQGQLDAELAQSDERALVKSFENPLWKRQYRHCCNDFFPAIPVSKDREGVELNFAGAQNGVSHDSPEGLPVSRQSNGPEPSTSGVENGVQYREKSTDNFSSSISSSSEDLSEYESDIQPRRSYTNERVYNLVSSEPSVANLSIANNDTAAPSEAPSNVDEEVVDTTPECPSLVLPLSFSLSLTIDRLPRCQSKPMDMYTFLCAQEFRRDEYGWHYKNVHCDIQGGLDGWVEYRCPLAQYGCTFSIKRLHPSRLGATVIHSEELESFGFKEALTTETEFEENPTEQLLNFDSLPFEILSLICLYLDSFSLCNLSKTCRRMRNVCFSRLKERGIILQQWIKSSDEGNVSWTPSKKKWLFSTAFSPVKTWVHTNSGRMSDHLHNCAYNIKHSHDERYYRVTPQELSRRIEMSKNDC